MVADNRLSLGKISAIIRIIIERGVIMLREILNSLLERKANLRVEASQVRTQTERNKINRELERVQQEIDTEKKRIPSCK